MFCRRMMIRTYRARESNGALTAHSGKQGRPNHALAQCQNFWIRPDVFIMCNATRPGVSFVILAYNHEGYIREALEGGCTQTYSPLEILLTDDNSSDTTFNVMREMAEAYHGPHRIDLSRNKTNHGIGWHVNLLMELAQRKLVIVVGGDDV